MDRATMTIFLEVLEELMKNRLETIKFLNIGLGWERIVNIEVPVNLASSVSFLKQNVLHEIKLTYPKQKLLD